MTSPAAIRALAHGPFAVNLCKHHWDIYQQTEALTPI
jgi:hypothetical protein